LKRGDDEKPSVVRVGEPGGGGLETFYMFFRQKADCEAYMQAQQKATDELR
jgi:hypothetical protein